MRSGGGGGGGSKVTLQFVRLEGRAWKSASLASASSAPCALRVIIKCGGGKTEAAASVFPPPHLIITRNAHGAEEAEAEG